MKNLLDLEKNRDYLQALKDNRKNLVPFLGAGFSNPTCPGWEDFLLNYFASLKKDNALLPKEITAFDEFKVPEKPNRLESMADFLVEKFPGPGFKAEMRRQMDVAAPPDMFKKFHLLHEAFPFLKITTNYDRLIETTVPPGVHVDVAYGCEGDKLERLFTHRHEQECLLKIHGGIADMNSIVLGTAHYGKLYGDEQRYDWGAALPSFLRRVFTTAPVLFIGCSLEHDRTTMILGDLAKKDGMPGHFAIMKLQGTNEEKILVQRRLAKLGICVIRIESYEQIEEILAYLVEKPPVPGVSWTKMGSFVGREGPLAEIAANLEISAADATGGAGGVQAITGRLYSIDGIGGVGKTALALEAARRFGNQFKDGVLPLFRADEHTPVSFARALAAGLGVPLAEPQDAEAARQEVALLLKNRRCLVLLDNVEKWEDLRYMIPPQMSAAVLVTTRNRDICRKISNHCPGLWVKEIPLDKFTREETLTLFRKMLGSEYREEDVDIYLEIGRALGFLPIALRQAIALMAYTPHYRAGELRDRLTSDGRLEILRRGCAEVESDTRVIETVFDLSAPVLTGELQEALGMMAVCSPGPVPLDFLEKLAKWPPEAKVPDLVELLERLYTYSWCERREVEGERYYELHQLVREVVRVQAQEAGGELPYLEEFIDVVHNIFTDKEVHFRVKERYIFQLEEAFAASVQRKDERLKDWLYDLYYFCTYRGYAHFYLRLTEAVERLFPGDKWSLRTVYGHRALILRHWGKLEEAMAMLKKQEAICSELDDRAGLSVSYGNQAGILQAWGKLEEAMAMLKKEEKIKEELGDRAGLSRSYGNQALILSDWGRLEEAMAMHKKEEAICEELGDRAGLSRSYGNQALILSDWGKLEEAMAMHKKQEAICEELGDRAGLSASYGNQAGILYAWERLEDGMDMYKKQEAICEELGDRAGLARTWWNQGFIFAKQGDSHSQAQLWRKSIDTNKSMGIPTAEDEKALKKLLKGKRGKLGN